MMDTRKKTQTTFTTRKSTMSNSIIFTRTKACKALIKNMAKETTTSYPIYTLGFSFGDISDPSQAIAVKYATGVSSYFDSLNKSEVKAIYNLSMTNLMHYPTGTIGSRDACEILGFLEDTYQDWIEEFEAN